LHDQYAQPIFKYCQRRLRSREEAEDAAQIVFLNAHRSLEEGVEPEFERAWLFKIAEHVIMYRRRTISRRARVEFPVDVEALANVVAAPERDVATELHGLAAALARIPEAQQRAIVLREWYGLSYGEVAAELGVSASTAETLIFRARRRLAEELGGPAPTSRRRRPLSLASPLATSKWLLGGAASVKALVGATSVVVLAVGSAKMGLLRLPAPAAPASVAQRVVVALPAAPSVAHVVVRRRVSVSAALPVRTVGRRPRPAAAPSTTTAPAAVPIVVADPVEAPVDPVQAPADPAPVPDAPAPDAASPQAQDPVTQLPSLDDRSAAGPVMVPVEELAVEVVEPAVTEPVAPNAGPPGPPGQDARAPGNNGVGPGQGNNGVGPGQGNNGVGPGQGNNGVGPGQGNNGVGPQQGNHGVGPAPHGPGSENGGQDLQ
jgi:RNA polymerase sigma-70 factor, ECF subfamily